MYCILFWEKKNNYSVCLHLAIFIIVDYCKNFVINLFVVWSIRCQKTEKDGDQCTPKPRMT